MSASNLSQISQVNELFLELGINYFEIEKLLENAKKTNLAKNLEQNSGQNSEKDLEIDLEQLSFQIQNLIKTEYSQKNNQTLAELEKELENELENLRLNLKLKETENSENNKFIAAKFTKNFTTKSTLESTLESENSGIQNTEHSESGEINKKTFLENKSLVDLEDLESQLLPNDMAYVRGQIVAKRALEIAASGGHNVLFLGSPGSGKTLLARAYAGILPSMTEEEILETTQIYSVAGMLNRGQIISQRPFRSPHHSASHVALVGGGSKIRPGEASLAHRGVLFLDEFPEFGRDTIEALRQPLEDGFVSIARASGSLTFPSKFYLLAAANPTPSGFDPDDPDALNKPQNRATISRYQARFSGPIMDRIDIHVEVSRPKKEELQSTKIAEKSSEIAKRVQKARDIQTERFREFAQNKPKNSMSSFGSNFIQSNSEMNLPLIQKFCILDETGQKILSNAIDRFKLSARAYMRLLKLSRTIADLDNNPNILPKHLAESLQYRGRWS